MTLSEPLVSIIVPSFNQGRYIEETLVSCLSQDYANLEVIVMDGGSTDETVAILERLASPKLRWRSEPDGGVTDAVNKGLVAAKGEILSIQSSDDLFLPGAVRAAVDALSAPARPSLVYGDVTLIDQNSLTIGKDVQGPFSISAYLGRLSYIPQPGTFFRREAFQVVGGWRKEVSYVADADMWLRIALRFPVQKLDRLVGCYRYHDEQRDKQRRRIAADWERMIRELMSEGLIDRSLGRWARMGVHLAHHRYLDETQWWTRTKALYSAALANPCVLQDQRFPKRELLPAREPVWKALSRLKRTFGITPRSP